MNWYVRESWRICCKHHVTIVLPSLGFLLFMSVLSGCTKPQITKVPSYEEARVLASKQGPFIDAPTEERNNLNCEDKAYPLAKDLAKGIPFTGNLVTNEKAACLIAIKAARDRLRKELDTERLSIATRKIINDAAYKNLAEQTRRSWWDRHGTAFMFSAGAAVGMAIVLGVLYAVTGGKTVSIATYLSQKGGLQ